MAVVAIIILFLMVILYVSLVFGAQLGYLAMGGKYEQELPTNMKIIVCFSIPIQLFAIYVLYQLSTYNEAFIYRVLGNLFMIVFFLNTLSNLASKSKYERLIMSPLAFFVSVTFAYLLYMV